VRAVIKDLVFCFFARDKRVLVNLDVMVDV
jgi:hypothetical protein